MSEAAEIMENGDDYILVDVRTPEEYAAGHIPGAILIPNQTITEAVAEELPDKDQTILVYCRSGSRSQQAAKKLADLGYTNMVEIGGINSWTGDIQTGNQP